MGYAGLMSGSDDHKPSTTERMFVAAPVAATLPSGDPLLAVTQGGERMAELPAKIDRFEIKSKLGEGGMGVVLLATDPLLGRRVAIKVLHRNPGVDAEAAKRRLLREAQGMAQLSNENVIVVHEVGTHGDQVYLAMEYVTGGTLGRWQADRGWREILELYRRAGQGLQAAHDAGLVHRDFKPDNVLVGEDGRVRVMDFGLVASAGDPVDQLSKTSAGLRSGSELVTKLTQTGAVMGTPRYMAPEQHLGHVVDARADQYSFCVALYEALYRQPPFIGTTYAELAEEVLAGRVVPVPADSSVPTTVRDAVLRGLRRDREMRHPSMRALLDALQVPAESVIAVRRRWPFVAVGGVLVVALGVGLVIRSTGSAGLTALGTGARLDAAIAEVARLDAAIVDAGRMTALERAHAEFDAAQLAYQHDDFIAAASHYLAAYGAREFPQFLFNVAASYQMQGKQTNDPEAFKKAVRYYKQYLAEVPQAEDRDKVEHVIPVIEAEIARLQH